MTQSLSERLRRLCIKSVYWSAFALGILPAPYNWELQKFHLSYLYRAYSVCIQIIFLFISPFAAPINARPEGRQRNYMQGLIVLQICYYLEKLIRIIANIVLFVQLWRKRKWIIDLFGRYKTFKEKYNDSHIDEELQDEEVQVTDNIISKLITGHVSIIMICALTICMQKNRDIFHTLLMTANSLQMYHLVTANMGFHIILSKLHLHFMYINRSLSLMSEDKVTPESLKTVWRLFHMHMECSELCQDVFLMFRSVTLFNLIKVFTTNVILLYHAVLFYTKAIETTGMLNFLGLMAILTFYWDNLLMMAAISTVQITCNEAAVNLGYLSCIALKPQGEEVNAEESEKCMQEFTKTVYQFHYYLECNEMDYNFFDMFSLNRESIFGYFVSAFEHLIILIQFDLTFRT